jgi:TPP-dependent pyruvate/acetoin dehydrogenase alpha subunit
MAPSVDTLKWLWRHMLLIRTFEEQVLRLQYAGVLGSNAHLYIGQEAVAAGVCAHLGPRDYVTGTHRGHGHAIAKGVEVRRMMAELYGRDTGTNRGKGGSKHIADPGVGMLGAAGIVGAGIPLAVGAAMSARAAEAGQVSVCFFGDGAMGQGIIYECLNLATIWHLPVVFICENNRYAQSTPVEYALGTVDLAARVSTFPLPTQAVDGQDVFPVYEAAGEAIARARAGGGPSFLECKTFRYQGHYFGDDPRRYRPAAEDEAAREQDCLRRFETQVVADRGLTRADLDAIRAEVEAAIDDAVRFAEASPLPDVAELETDVYTPIGALAGLRDGR